MAASRTNAVRDGTRNDTRPRPNLAAFSRVGYATRTHWVQWALHNTQMLPYTDHSTIQSMQSLCDDAHKRLSTGHGPSDRRDTTTARSQDMPAVRCDAWVAWCVGSMQEAPYKPTHDPKAAVGHEPLGTSTSCHSTKLASVDTCDATTTRSPSGNPAHQGEQLRAEMRS